MNRFTRVSRPPIEVRNETTIRASAERVWDLLADVANWPTWWRACRWVQVEPAGGQARAVAFLWRGQPGMVGNVGCYFAQLP